MKEEFLKAVEAHREEFGVSFGGEALEVLGNYYEFLISRNDVLHLVAPCSPEEFAVRHILESLFISNLIPNGVPVADVGSGGGLPGIPLAIARDDIRVILIESKAKKASFLDDAIKECGVDSRVKVINRQFDESRLPANCVVIARALDKFPVRLPRLVKWAGKRMMILFGGPGLEDALAANRTRFKKVLIPRSEQRFVFVVGAPIA